MQFLEELSGLDWEVDEPNEYRVPQLQPCYQKRSMVHQIGYLVHYYRGHISSV